MLWLSALGSVSAQTATFDLKGVSIELQEVTADTAVFFRSLRLNRALNQWNVEVTVSNRADRALSGPLVLLVESFRGTSGPLLVDGTLGGATPRAFYDLSSLTPSGELGAHQSTASRTLSLGFTTGSPVLVTRVFAGTLPPPVPIGVTRSLNDVGQPLAGTTLTVTGPAAGSSAVQTTDRPTGVASFGETAGAHGLKFTQEGSLSVWRQQTLFTGSVAVVPNPRLTPRSSRVIEVTPLGGSVVTNDTGTVRIGVNAGAFGGSASLRLTGLTGQTLPAFLPQGWSPLQAFHLETSSAPTQPLPASLKPFGSVGTTEVAALARWNETTLLWEVVQVVGGRGAEPLDVLLPTAGSFVLVVGDSGELAPPVPIVGQPLVSSQAPVEPIAGLTATGVVDPSSSPASQVPVRVTGQATVTLNHASAKLPSGTLLRGEVTETYLLKDGSFRITPSYEQFFVAYQRPGDEDLQTIQASFPMRPLLLFGAEELSTATVRIDVLPLTPFDGRVVDQRGGQLALPGGRVLIGAGQLSAATAFRLSPLSVSPITNSLPLTMSAVTGFELTFDASRLTGPLSPRFDGLAPNASFVLARVLSEVGLFGLEPVERFQTDAQGVVSSGEAISGDRLAGIRGSGQYVLIKVDRAQGLISGVARDGKGSLRSGMPVRAAGTPWVALTDNQGRFHLVAAVGTQQIEVTDPATGDTGASAVTVTDPLQVVGQDLASAPAGPRVVSTTPADAARQVPLVTSVIVQFSEPVNPLTLIGDAIQLIGPDNAVVSASVSLNLANRIATLSPGSDLNPGTVYRVVLAGTIADASGLRLEGKSQFTFTTAAASVRTASSQLVIYEPGATNVPVAILDDIPAYEPGQDPTAIVVHGTPGTADPEVPVILANESTGETATVLSKVDGSFSSVISGSEEDFVSATFVNLNKTRVYVPVSRQEFDNGFVGLYRTGGILEAQSDGGPVKVIIKPEVISNRTKLRMKPMSRAQLLQETDGAEPDAGGLAANPMRLEIEGDPITEPINISFAVNLLTAGFPRDADPGQAGLALTRVLDVNGIKTFEVVDQLIFHPGSFATNSIQPSPAPRLQDVINDENEELFYGAADLLIGFLPVTGIDVGQAVFQYIFVPLLIGNKAVTVKGKTLTSASAEETHAAGGAADAAVEAALDLTTSKPLQGSFIALKRVSVPVGQRGRLQPGMVHATSGADGRFLLVAPYANDAYILTATHPRFDDVLSEPVVGVFDLGLAGAVFKTFRFRQPLALQTAPTVNIAHTPLTPAPGDEVEVQITATHGPGAAPPSITVLLDSVKSLVQGVEVDASEAKIVAGPPVAIGPYTTRWTGKVSIAKAARVVIRAIVIGSNKQSHTPIRYPIDFDGRPQPDPDNPIPSPDPEDKKGPLVITTLPNERGFVNENGEISIFFNEPIDRSVLQQLSGIVLDGPSTFSPPVLELSPDQTTLQIRYLGLKPGADYSLSLSSLSLRDLLGNPFDQVPNTKPSDNFVLHFKTSPVKVTALPEITAGKGAVMHGVHLYVLQAGTENQLIAYDVSRPNTPVLLSHPRVVGVPRDLVVIPDFGYKTAPDDSVHNGEIVAVVGGDLDTKIDELGNVTVPGQNLVVFDMADPKNPRQLAAATISYRVASAVTKLRWEPPYLVYQEFGADLHQIGFIDLQEFIWGFSAPVVRRDTFPVNGRRGQDNNGDGDYVDEGEILPIPELRPPEFYGKKISYPLEDTRQKVLDFSVSAGVVGITLTGGVSPSGVALRPSYRTLAFNGQPLDRTLATYGFHVGSYPRRVFCQAGVPVEVGGRLETLVVALVGLAADFDGKNRLAVLDITLPESPKLINTIEIPEALLGGGLQAIQQREDGSLLVATSQNILTLEPRLLGVTNFPAGQLHPSVTGIVPQAGSGTPSYASSSFGVHGVAQGGRAQVLQTPPPMTFVQFPERPELVASAQFPLKNSEIQTLLGQLRPVRSLFPARVRKALDKPSDLLPPRPAAHFYVLMEAPGGSGHKVELGLEALTSSGRPLANLGVGFAPVRAASFLAQRDLKQLPRENCDAPMRSLTAYRMSDDSNSPYYNFYLSKAFAVVYESVTIAELEELRSAADREILFVSAFLRAFIDPSESVNSGVGAFAAQIDFDELTLQPPASATAFCLELPYIMGENTTPLAGAVTMAGSHGTVNAHSGEFRTEETDMALPSPMMPITIERAIGGQDHYNGPFGYGWDFNYNQRLTELNPEVFPLGLEMPLIDRGTRADSVLGSSKDILLHSGAGRLVRFRWVSDSMPPEYAQDPLVRQFNYAATVAAYYLPEPGSFDLLVKFKNGTFERLSSGGQRHRYAANGRLELVMDAYPKNRHELTYDRSGLLVRIDDRSVADDRFVEFGYYRMAGDRAFTAELDELTTDPYRQGKVRRLRDYVGRDVLFVYNDMGELIRREGVHVSGQNGGFGGRPLTHYHYENCKIKGVSITQQGLPLVGAEIAPGKRGAPVAQKLQGAGGTTVLDIPPSTTAANLGGLTTSSKRESGETTEHTFNKHGYPEKTRIFGGNGPAAEVSQTFNTDGLVLTARDPEGGVTRYTYDSSNPIFRSRANLLQTVDEPGPRGGDVLTRTMSYDPRYNQPSGAQVDANGFTTVIQLTADGRSVASVVYDGKFTDTYDHNDLGQITRVADHTGIVVVNEYDARTGFQLAIVTGDSRSTSEFGGGIAGRLGHPTRVIPPEGDAMTLIYNEALQVVERVRGTSRDLLAMDEQGRAVLQKSFIGEGKFRETSYEFNTKGFMTRSSVKDVEVDGGTSSLEYRFTPDSLSRVKTIVHPNGLQQTYEYNSRGQVTKAVTGDYTEEYNLDLLGNVKELKQGGEIVLERSYDGHNRPVRTVTKSGSKNYVLTQSYHPGGEPKESILVDPDDGVVQAVHVEQIDVFGRVLKYSADGDTIHPTWTYQYGPGFHVSNNPRMTTRGEWDSSGFPTTFQTPILKTIHTVDRAGRVRAVERQEPGATFKDTLQYNNEDQVIEAGDLLGRIFKYEPRTDGNVTAIENALGHRQDMSFTQLGELQRESRADGMQTHYRRNAERQLSYLGDPNAGITYGYDGFSRLIRRTQRDGGAFIYSNFDPRQQPQRMQLPGGGEVNITYDLLKRVIEQKTEFLGTTYQANYTYDAMGRTRRVSYKDDTQTAANVMTARYDKAGPLLESTTTEEGQVFNLRYSYYEDATLKTLTYPSGAVLTEVRDETGRLTALNDANGPIMNVVSWNGVATPRLFRLGRNVEVRNLYDERGRLTASRAVRVSDSAVLTHTRYLYDPANNLVGRQFLHRGGRADAFGYDVGERLSSAVVGGYPADASIASLKRSRYQRGYTYNAEGLDYIEQVATTGALADRLPFASEWSNHDAFLHPQRVDGFDRGPADPMGRTTKAQLRVAGTSGSETQPMAVQLVNNGVGALVRVEREDGLRLVHSYQPDGKRFMTVTTQNGAPVARRHYVHDSEGRLLEEYLVEGAQRRLVGRYYYATSDAPLAADLWDAASASLKRYYYLKELAQSVLVVVDENGSIVERMWYDPFGQAAIEGPDNQRPLVNGIRAGDGSSLLISFSEPVGSQFVDPGIGVGLVPVNANLSASLFLQTAAGVAIPGDLTFVEGSAGEPASSVLRFAPHGALGGAMKLTLTAGGVMDEAGNTNLQQVISFSYTGQANAVYFSSNSVTSPTRYARSSVGSPFLFHGKYVDYDAGLIHMGARFYDPYSGLFNAPDPLDYEDSVNPYAAFGNNPTSGRDPTGLNTDFIAKRAVRESRKFLQKRGLEDLEMQAIYNVMARRKQNINLSIRRFVKYDKESGHMLDAPTEWWRRKRSMEGMEKKYAFSKAKGNEEALGHMKTPSRAKKKRMQDWSREFDVTGDIDLLHIEIDGRFASVKEIRDLVGDINREYRKLHHQAYAKAGVTKIPRAHTPFKHEAQAQLLHQAGNIVGKELDKAGQNMVIGANGLVDPGKAYITMDTIGAIGHPGDAFQISSSHGASGLSFAARDLQRSEVGTILRRGQDDARRLFLENSREGGAFRHQLMRSNQYGLPTWPESVTNKRWPEGTGDTTFGY